MERNTEVKCLAFSDILSGPARLQHLAQPQRSGASHRWTTGLCSVGWSLRSPLAELLMARCMWGTEEALHFHQNQLNAKCVCQIHGSIWVTPDTEEINSGLSAQAGAAVYRRIDQCLFEITAFIDLTLLVKQFHLTISKYKRQSVGITLWAEWPVRLNDSKHKRQTIAITLKTCSSLNYVKKATRCFDMLCWFALQFSSIHQNILR